MNQFGPAPRKGVLFTGQERRFKIRSKNINTQPLSSTFGFGSFNNLGGGNSLVNINKILGG